MITTETDMSTSANSTSSPELPKLSSGGGITVWSQLMLNFLTRDVGADIAQVIGNPESRMRLDGDMIASYRDPEDILSKEERCSQKRASGR